MDERGEAMTDNPFHRYPQAGGSHPDRPWWIQIGELYWARIDDTILHRLEYQPDHPLRLLLDAYDREHPMPVPEPRCGQVWCTDGDADWIVTEVEYDEWGWRLMKFSSGFGADRWATEPNAHKWPTDDGVLIYGPGAPWAPLDWEPKESG